MTQDPATDPYAAAANAAAAVSAASTAKSQGEPQKQAREGNLPGSLRVLFYVGFGSVSAPKRQ